MSVSHRDPGGLAEQPVSEFSRRNGISKGVKDKGTEGMREGKNRSSLCVSHLSLGSLLSLPLDPLQSQLLFKA